MPSILTLRKVRGEGFLANFYVRAPLREPDSPRAVAGLRYAMTADEKRVLIRTWRDSPAIQADLDFFWQEELRLHQRLQAQEYSHNCIGPLVASGSDTNGYHAVLALDGRSLLAEVQQRTTYRSAYSTVERTQQWRNVAQLARAVCALHREGIAHGSIDAWSVVVDPQIAGSAQLTGFEWSWRKSTIRSSGSELSQEYAFAQDWRDLASLVSTLMASEDELEREEKSLLRNLREPVGSIERWIVKKIESIADRLGGQGRTLISLAKDERIETFAQGLLLLPLLQSALSAANECAIRIERVTTRGRRIRLVVRPREDPERDKLRRLLGDGGPASERLRHFLTEEHGAQVDSWALWDFSEGDGAQIAQLHFVRTQDRYRDAYLFEADEQIGSIRAGVLVDTRTGRWDGQFRRQLAAWSALRGHQQLLKSLVDPSLETFSHISEVLEDQKFQDMDKDKQQALRALLAIGPLFLVHGPPGVGKTRLVTEFARQQRQCMPQGKSLVSAQSHAAVDQLLTRMAKLHAQSSLLVRCRARGAQRAPTEFDQALVAKRILSDVFHSSSLNSASEGLRATVRVLAAAPADGSTSQAIRFNAKPVEALLLRSADFVFGTSNCAAFEYLRSVGIQFDWSVVEEAAKATGAELLNSLMLAPRRLMIGDHRQLPAFSSTELTTLLGDVPRIGQILRALAKRAGPDARRDVRRLQRIFEDVDGSSAALLCEQARRGLLLFEELLASPSSTLIFKHELTQQHRMHPAISRVVSHAFYGDKLQSSEDCERKFASEAPPVRSRHPKSLPDLPLVWIEMPWVQSTFGHKGSERRPGPHNVDEIKVVMQTVMALEPLHVKGREPTSLVILTPYRKQLQMIEEAIEQDKQFRNDLEQFRPVGGAFVHTVDSFQGNEADVVVVSLVRNNPHSSIRGALGFLCDERRMNVLLSRAEWRLVLVGSQEFLRGAVDRTEQAGDGPSAQFLKRLFEAFDNAQRDGNAVVVRPWGER